MSKDKDDDAQDLEELGIKLVFGDIDTDMSKEIITWILEHNCKKSNKIKELNLIINSVGGDLYDAFAVVDTMLGSKIPVNTTGIGTVASAALVIFLAGQKGNRVLTPNTCILSHQWSGGAIGKSHELVAVKKDYDLTNERMMNHYKKMTGLKVKQIEEQLLPAHDVYLNAKEALELNICDKIKEL